MSCDEKQGLTLRFYNFKGEREGKQQYHIRCCQQHVNIFTAGGNKARKSIDNIKEETEERVTILQSSY
jgi:hypothetical protein